MQDYVGQYFVQRQVYVGFHRGGQAVFRAEISHHAAESLDFGNLIFDNDLQMAGIASLTTSRPGNAAGINLDAFDLNGITVEGSRDLDFVSGMLDRFGLPGMNYNARLVCGSYLSAESLWWLC